MNLIVKNHKRLIAPQDILINLGDIIFYNSTNLAGYLKQLPCRHILVRGNHDKKSDGWFINQGFSMVCEMLVMKGVLLSHHPVETPQLPKDIKLTINGHLHTHCPKGQVATRIEGSPVVRYTMSLEYHNYTPINLNSLISQFVDNTP
jgi:calcineurin-like phosphoesterase family protein